MTENPSPPYSIIILLSINPDGKPQEQHKKAWCGEKFPDIPPVLRKNV
jgi:hypothetical protein